MASPARAADPYDTSWVDEAVAPFGVFVEAMSVASTAAVSGSDYIPTMWVEHLAIDLPFEMDVLVDDGGGVHLAGGPPTQYTETTIMPVFHRIRLEVKGEIATEPQQSGEGTLGGPAESQLAS